ncbi:hypothetical protein [Thalassobacillus sp. CUG 92003]|uniref:hypothetical protein n=1 Tax=Thalassobacillus sp. CUG 92003 TaxID=2736641 RepID=UPI0015E6FAC8|nr:hypothetical protein [Thalassobacillus sp. CUG 92003]
MQITDEARDMIDLLLKDQSGGCLRIYFAGYGCSEPQLGMALEEPQAEDQLENINSIPVAIDQKIIYLTEELVIDGKQTMEGPKFKMLGLPEDSC